MTRVPRSAAATSAVFAGLLLGLTACVSGQSSSSERPPAYPPPPSYPAPAYPPPSYPPPPYPPAVVQPAPAPEVVYVVPPPAGRVRFFSEPNFRGESFVVEAGAAVENLDRLPRPRGSWNDRISSFRIEGVATVVAYTDAGFRGPRLETSSSLGDLVAERRGAEPEQNWDHVISSLRVIPPRGRPFDPEPGYDARTAENIVRRAYQDILGRAPDRDGLQNYREKLMSGGWSEDELRSRLRASEEFRRLDPDVAITRAYREVLKREPDPEGLRHYRELLTKHGWTDPQLRADLLRSDEKSEAHVRAVITRAYRELLGREPDPDGMATYLRAVRDKAWDERKIRDALMNSAEYRQRPPK